MKHVDEYRAPDAVQRLVERIQATAGDHRWTLMEVCGGQTHAIVRFGLDRMLPGIELVHGPGCPVCVTPLADVDAALQIAARPEVIFCTFGDMLRVPGSETDLYTVKARGADVRVVYSPTDALQIARDNADREVVFFAVGFETTAPANALLAHFAHRQGLRNLTLLVSHVLVPPAIEAVCAAAGRRVQGFLAAGHVCTVTGCLKGYPELAARHRVPIVVTGFEPVDLLRGVLACVRQLESGRHEVENHYTRVSRDAGNAAALRMLDEVFAVCDRSWRGLGVIPASGLALRERYADLDARRRFRPAVGAVHDPVACHAAAVLQGLLRPGDCPSFATTCTPERPLGAPMVSNEGACAAWYRWRRHDAATSLTAEDRR